MLLSNSTKIISLKYDTVATVNYIRGKDTIILKNPQPTTTGPRVHIPDNSIIQPTIYGHLPLPTLPSESTQAHAYPNLNSASFLSIGQLYNYDCSALFTKKDVTSDNTPVLKGRINTSDGLWDVKITSSQPESSPTAPTTSNTNHILFLDKTKSELDIYLHAASVCPTKTTFFQKIHNWGFITCPGLTSKLIS